MPWWSWPIIVAVVGFVAYMVWYKIKEWRELGS